MKKTTIKVFWRNRKTSILNFFEIFQKRFNFFQFLQFVVKNLVFIAHHNFKIRQKIDYVFNFNAIYNTQDLQDFDFTFQNL